MGFGAKRIDLEASKQSKSLQFNQAPGTQFLYRCGVMTTYSHSEVEILSFYISFNQFRRVFLQILTEIIDFRTQRHPLIATMRFCALTLDLTTLFGATFTDRVLSF